MKRKTTGLY